MAEFVSIEEDKFEKKTTYQTSKGLNLSETCETIIIGGDFKLYLRRINVMPDNDTLVFDVHSECDNWFFLRQGKMIILVDGETIELEPHESYAHTANDGVIKCVESDFYCLSKELLEKICRSSSFAMRIYGKNSSIEIANNNAVVVFCKLFYNAVYDGSMYQDVVDNCISQFTDYFGDINKFESINLDGSGAKGGCMGMLALLLTLGGAAIGGVCSLI